MPTGFTPVSALIGGAVIGTGWGFVGYCPGPALANLAHGTPESVVFVAAMLAGSQLARLVPRT